MQPQEKVLNLESKKFTSPAPQIKGATQHRRPRHMAGSGRKQSRGVSSQAPPPPQRLLVMCSLPVGITVPTYLRVELGGQEAGETTSMDSRLSIVFFPDSALSSFLYKTKINYTSITSLLFILSICLLPSILPSQVMKYTTCCTSVTASTAVAN